METFTEDGQLIKAYCPTCRTITDVWVMESFNYGNLLGECEECGDQFDITAVDHKAILAEARRAF